MAANADIRLIDPNAKQLAAALKKAHIAANRELRNSVIKLERDDDFWQRFARDCLREREGRRRSCKGGWLIPEVIAGWWTDPANRRHFRIVGRTRSRWRHRARAEGELRSLPPWWQVYPESVLAVRDPKGDGETYLACCRCGKVGSPDSLGWMGDTCGPCFDRRADGGIPVGGFGHFSGWGSNFSRVGFSFDGTCLAGQNHTNKLRVVARHDGTERQVQKGVRLALPNVVGVVDGFLVGAADGAVHRWNEMGNVQLLGKPRLYGRCVISPDGRWAIAACQNTGFTADLTAKKPTYTQVDGRRVYSALAFAPTSDQLFALTFTNELIALDPETLTETVAREDVFSGLAPHGYPREISVSADKSMVVVVRENYPSTTTVRVIPLNAKHPVYDLPLPGWHRPNGVAIAPDGKHLATADQQAGWVGIWRLPSGKPLGYVRAVPEDPSYRGGQISFSPDGSALAVSYLGTNQQRGSTVVVWPWPDVMQALE